MSNELLPPNATKLERNLAGVTSRISNTDLTAVNGLWNPDTCPLELLPWLAWAERVPNWSTNWSEPLQRSSIKAQRAVRKQSGTKQAVVDAVNSFGGTVAIREWFEMSPQGVPHTFDVTITGGADYIEAGLQTAMINSIDSVKPVRSHYTLAVGLTAEAPLYMSGIGQVATYLRLQFTD